MIEQIYHGMGYVLIAVGVVCLVAAIETAYEFSKSVRRRRLW